eukprot:1159792-Pelagomonas_calceolata.AAC.11
MPKGVLREDTKECLSGNVVLVPRMIRAGNGLKLGGLMARADGKPNRTALVPQGHADMPFHIICSCLFFTYH